MSVNLILRESEISYEEREASITEDIRNHSGKDTGTRKTSAEPKIDGESETEGEIELSTSCIRGDVQNGIINGFDQIVKEDI